jgi:nicotinamide riboside kinase
MLLFLLGYLKVKATYCGVQLLRSHKQRHRSRNRFQDVSLIPLQYYHLLRTGNLGLKKVGHNRRSHPTYTHSQEIRMISFKTEPHLDSLANGNGINKNLNEISLDSPKNVYIIGPQCTGKSTLVKALENAYKEAANENRVQRYAASPQPTIVQEVARTVFQKQGFTRNDLRNSKLRALQVQEYILEAQRNAESAASADTASTWYICDRSGLDPIVYAHMYVGAAAAADMLASDTWQYLERKMKQGIVFLCEAGCSWLVDDGTRLMPSGVEEWMKTESVFREQLVARDIKYSIVPRDMGSLQERVQLVKKTIEAARP